MIALNLHLEIKVYLCCNNKTKDIGFLIRGRSLLWRVHNARTCIGHGVIIIVTINYHTEKKYWLIYLNSRIIPKPLIAVHKLEFNMRQWQRTSSVFKEAEWATNYQSNLPSLLRFELYSYKLLFSKGKFQI